MTQEMLTSEPLNNHSSSEYGLPFPHNQRAFCHFEPIEKRIDSIRVLVVDNLLRDENDLSEVGRQEWGASVAIEIQRERKIAEMAIDNILKNIARLVVAPETRVVHVSEVAEAAAEFKPQAIVLSGTLRDFDYYQQSILDSFGGFVRATEIPVLAICGGHQLVGLSFGARVVTLDDQEQHERREGRPTEYQYRYVLINEPSDPIFANVGSTGNGEWQATETARIMRVWQNHGLKLDRIPEGFSLLATSFSCRNQMMVKRDHQLIYTVQFHLEKSFEDWHKTRTRWEHPNDSRAGRILFENFLLLALEHSSD